MKRSATCKATWPSRTSVVPTPRSIACANRRAFWPAWWRVPPLTGPCAATICAWPNSLAHVYGAVGQYQVAVKLAHEVVQSAESAVHEHPSQPDALADLAAAESTLADILAGQKDYASIIPVRERVLELTRRAIAARPGVSTYNLAVAHKRLAALYAVTGRYNEAHSHYEEARTLDEARFAAGPPNLNTKFDLSYDYSDLGWLASRRGDAAGALAGYRRALALRQEAVAADPNNYRAAVGVASLVNRIAGVLRSAGDFPGRDRRRPAGY